jgi:hypothetical protein
MAKNPEKRILKNQSVKKSQKWGFEGHGFSGNDPFLALRSNCGGVKKILLRTFEILANRSSSVLALLIISDTVQRLLTS